MLLFEIQVDSDGDHLHMLKIPKEGHVLSSYFQQEWAILLEGCLGKAFTGFSTEVTKPSPGACTDNASGNIDQLGGFSENKAAALGQTGWR